MVFLTCGHFSACFSFLIGRSLIQSGFNYFDTGFWNDAKTQTVELWNNEGIVYGNTSLVDQLDSMAWILALATSETLPWKYALTGSYQGESFHHQWPFLNYVPSTDGFMLDPEGTFVFGTCTMRNWALPAPVKYRSVVMGSNFFQRVNGRFGIDGADGPFQNQYNVILRGTKWDHLKFEP